MTSILSSPHRPSLNEHLFSHAKVPDPLRHLIVDIARSVKYIQSSLRTTEAGLSGRHNQFGEEQLKLDVLSDAIIQKHLQESHLVSSFASEEQDALITIDAKLPYTVVYDPLDGSSLVEADFAIGSIFGIYHGHGFVGKCAREQVAALYCLYGPRTILVYCASNGVHAFLLNEVGEFILLRENLGIADVAKNYSPGNLRAIHDNAAYASLMDVWMHEGLTLRYSGCMVADLHHILSKGQGIFSNVGGSSYPEGKLRLAFECGPFAYILEQAGGISSNGHGSILDLRILSLDQRTPFLAGSKLEVLRSCKVLNGRVS